MNDRIKEAFDQVRAETELKDKTKAFVSGRTSQYGKQKKNGQRSRALGRTVGRVAFSTAACCLCFLLGFGGYHVYFTPTAVISIDINPSIELGINRFDRVISVTGYNEDGRMLAESLDVRFMDYNSALHKILENESVEGYLSRDELLSVVVVDSDEEQGKKMLSRVEACVAGHENAYCHSAGTGAVAGAHAAGFSYGKYLAFLELQALDPEITAEKAQGLTMRQIREMILQLSPEGAAQTEHHEEEPERHEAEPEHHEEEPERHEEEPEHHGSGHGHGHGKE